MKNPKAEELFESLTKQHVRLVAVSKTKPIAQIKDLYDLGVRDFGENRVQELVEKQPLLPNDIRWHMIGNLQKNKVKYIAPFVDLIHSVSSANLVKSINKEAQKNSRTINILLQIKIAEELSKSGLEKSEAIDIIEDFSQGIYPHIRLTGFMGMATFTDDMVQVRREFKILKEFSIQMTAQYPDVFSDYGDESSLTETTNDTEPILSMGMSGDYKEAIEEGSNMVRIGSLIFGSR